MIHREEFPVNVMCRVLRVSRSGFYEWRSRKESKRAAESRSLLEEIKSVFVESDETYGSPRVASELKACSIECSESRVARLMRKASLCAVAGRKFKHQTTNSNHSEPIAENIIEQDFSASKLGEKVGCDITYISTTQGFLYLAVVLDFYSRKILGYAFSDSLDSKIVCHALMRAAATHRLPKKLLHHSDRGSQYASAEYRELLRSLGIRQSMSRAGNPYDNALVESFFHNLKVERANRKRYSTRETAKLDVKNYIDNWYNCQRRHSSLDMMSPSQFIENQMVQA